MNSPVLANSMLHGLSLGCMMLLACVTQLACATRAQADQPLADFQRIVVADDALPVTRLAAEELATHLALLTGKQLPLVNATPQITREPGLSFFVGEQAAAVALGRSPAPWQREEWMLKTVPAGLVLAGHDAPGKANTTSTAGGSALAVYSLLDDELGIRWLWPGDDGLYIPEKPAATIPTLDKRQQPRFIIRNYSVGYGSDQTMAFRQQTGMWARRTRQGWVPAATFGHSWYYAFDLKKKGDENPYLKDHPDWFALVNGQRRPPQMCTTHPQVIQRMVEYVLADTKRAITTISPSDGGGFCQCDEQTKSDYHKQHNIPSCTSLDVPGILSYDQKTPQLSDRIFTYANEVARRVREKDPDKGVGMFAYTFYNKPPVHIKKLEPNLYLSFVFQAQSHVDPQMYQEWLDSIAGWQKIGARMIVREGWGNHYLLDLPFIYPREIHHSLHKASELGFIAAYGEGSKSFATQAPNTWAVVRTMWNPDIDYDALMADFYTSAYGPAAGEMRAYFETYEKALHDNWPNRRFIAPSRGVAYVNIVNSWDVILPASVVDAAEVHLKKAEAVIRQSGPSSQYARRVALGRIGQDYARVMLELLDCYRQLAHLGMDMEFFSAAVDKPVYDLEKRDRILKRAYELGEQREDMLLAHRDLPGPDEGLYAITNRLKMRQWHANVKRLLRVDKPTRVTRELLSAMDPANTRPAKPSEPAVPAKPASGKPAVTRPAVKAAAAVSFTQAFEAIAPTWPLAGPSQAASQVLAIGEGYGNNEIATIKREVFDPLYTRVTISQQWIPAAKWSDHPLVIVAGMNEALKSADERQAVLAYLQQGGRLMLLGTAMRSFDGAPPDVLAAIGASGYAVVKPGREDNPKINTRHPDTQAVASQADALRKAFASGYGVKTLSPGTAILAMNQQPVAFISAHGQGRTLYIGRELFRVRIEEKREKKDLGGDALRDWITALVKQIAPAKTGS